MSREIDGDLLVTVPGDDLGNRAFAELGVEDPLTDVVGRHDGIDPNWRGDWRREGSSRRSGSIESRPVPDAANVCRAANTLTCSCGKESRKRDGTLESRRP